MCPYRCGTVVSDSLRVPSTVENDPCYGRYSESGRTTNLGWGYPGIEGGSEGRVCVSDHSSWITHFCGSIILTTRGNLSHTTSKHKRRDIDKS